MNRLNLKLLTATVLIALILVSSYCSLATAKESEWEAQTMHRIKAYNIDPDVTIGDGTPYFNPAKIQAVYNLPTDPGAGTGTTIAIVDAYDNPKVATDLALFSSQFGLPAANFELHKMSSFIPANSGWAMEISLDVQWAHAIAPGAKILLVEARSSSLTDLLNAVNYARNRADVSAISMSWGGSEFSGQTSYDSYFTSQYGASFFASSGDTGGVISWPSSSANVIAVGGTTLTQTGTSYTETAWSGSGGGKSTQVAKPTYQTATSYSVRTTPDVAYNADPNTGFLVINNYGYSTNTNWWIVGGTSAGAPQWAAIQAIGKTATNNNFYLNFQQNYGKDFSDVIGGTSGGFSAVAGYDLSTGIGSPIGTDFGVPPAPDFTVSASPSALTINAGSSATTTVTVTALGGFTNPVTITAAAGWTTDPPITINPTASTPLTITAPSSANGPYQVAITATDGTTSKTIYLSVQVTIPDFSLTANPTSLTIRQGNSGSSRITVNAVNNYQGAVTLSVSGTPSGMTASFSKNPVQQGSYATMALTTARTTAQGTYTITVIGNANGLSHTTQVTVTVRR
jgi:subtilase family serine protease